MYDLIYVQCAYHTGSSVQSYLIVNRQKYLQTRIWNLKNLKNRMIGENQINYNIFHPISHFF